MRNRRRVPIAAVLAVLVIIPVIGLAWMLHDESESHRTNARRMLDGIVVLAAEDYGRRIAIALDIGLTMPMLSAALEAEQTGGRGSLPGVDDAQPDHQLLARVAKAVFSYDRGDSSVIASNPDAVDLDWLSGVVDDYVDALPANYYGAEFIVRRCGDEPLAICCSARRNEHDEIDFVLGFVAEWAKFSELFSAALGMGAPIADSIAPDAGASVLTFRVEAGDGLVLFESAPRPNRAIGHRVELERRHANLVLQASLDAGAADAVLAGGVPRSRWPEISGLLVAIVAPLIAAAWIMRREHALARLQSDFVASVSHELRTPLAQIRLFAETLLLDRVRSEEERRRSLGILDHESRRLGALVENILQFSRAQRDALNVDPVANDVGLIVEEVAEAYRPLARSRDATIDVDCALPPATVDAAAFRIVIANLLDNAIKYGPRGQTIRVTGSVLDGRIRICVDDQGDGVAPGDRQRVWDKFWRASANDDAVAGVGIGLALVKEIVGLHRGDVRVEDARGGGARFVVEVPVA